MFTSSLFCCHFPLHLFLELSQSALGSVHGGRVCLLPMNGISLTVICGILLDSYCTSTITCDCLYVLGSGIYTIIRRAMVVMFFVDEKCKG